MAKLFSFLKVVTDLMYEIEKLPASEQQTKVILMAGDLKSVLEKYHNMTIASAQPLAECKSTTYKLVIGVALVEEGKEATFRRFLQYEVELPFIPFIGLTITDSDHIFCKLENLIYHNKEEIFLYNMPVITGNIEYIKRIFNEYLEDGWKTIISKE